MRQTKLVVALALVMAVSSTAWAIGIPTDGPFVITLNNWDMGTIYTEYAPANVHDLTKTLPAPGSWNTAADRLWDSTIDFNEPDLEDGWGVFVIDHIYYGKFTAVGGIGIDETRDPYYALASSDKALVGMFYSIKDTTLGLPGPGGEQLTTSNNMDVKIWEQDKYDGGGDMFAEVGSAGRLALDEYAGMGNYAGGGPNATLWAELEGETGFIPADPNAEMASVFQPDYLAGSGNAKMFLDCIGGMMYTDYVLPGLVTDYFGTQTAPGANGETCHLFMNMTTDVNNPINVVGGINGDGNDWTAVSNDDVVGYAIPEPMTLVAVGLAVTGLGGYIRKRRAA